MNRETRIELMFHAFRWANNMVVEAIGNHAAHLPVETREVLRDATQAMSRAIDALRAAA